VLLNERQYKKVVAKWQKYRSEKKHWGNRNMVNNTNRDIKQHLKKAGIKPTASFSIHTLRKCAGKNWAMSNRDPAVTQKLMGHSSVVTTLKHYTTVTDEDRAKAAEKIEALLVNAKKVYVLSTSEPNLDKNTGSDQF
jgi:integrase